MNAEDFVTYEQALALKKLGFNENCFYHYNLNKELRANFSIDNNACIIEGYFLRNNTNFSICITAPTLAQAQKWILTNNKVFITVEPYFVNWENGNYSNPKYEYIIVDNDGNRYESSSRKTYFDSPEEAMSAGITDYIVEFLKENK